jgi:Na+/alanine symporter
MTIPNLIAILLLRVEVKSLVNDYWHRVRSQGE